MNYHIIDSEFNKKLSTAYQLSILVGMDSLVYFVFDAGKDDALLLKTYSFQNASGEKPDLKKELEEVFAKDELLAYLFRRVKITMPFAPSALVPERLYNEAEKPVYIQELTDIPNDDNVQTDEVSDMALRILYPTEPGIVSLLKKQFPTGKLYSPVTPFLLGCRKMMEEVKDYMVFTHFLNDKLHISVFEKQNLLFYNSFSYTSANDVLYYVLLVFGQFKLEPSVVPLNLSGHIMEQSEIFKMLFRYVSRLGFMPEPPFLKFNRKFGEVPPHIYFDLYSLHLCK